MLETNPTTIPQGQISILAGASGAGKTTLLMQAIAAASRGKSFLPEFTWKGEKGIAYVAADRPIEEVLSLAKRLEVNEDKVEFYSIVDDQQITAKILSTPSNLFNLAKSKFSKPFDVLILDPIGLFIDGNIINYHHVARSLVPMNQFATREGVTIIATHHSRKARIDQKFARPQDRIAGSTAFLGYSGTQMVLVPANEENDDQIREDQLFIIPHTLPAIKVFLQRGQDGLLHKVQIGVPKLDNVVPMRRESKTKDLRET